MKAKLGQLKGVLVEVIFVVMMGPLCTTKDDKLDGMNFAKWKLKMRIWFIHNCLWEIVQDHEKEAEPSLKP